MSIDLTKPPVPAKAMIVNLSTVPAKPEPQPTPPVLTACIGEAVPTAAFLTWKETGYDFATLERRLKNEEAPDQLLDDDQWQNLVDRVNACLRQPILDARQRATIIAALQLFMTESAWCEPDADGLCPLNGNEINQLIADLTI